MKKIKATFFIVVIFSAFLFVLPHPTAEAATASSLPAFGLGLAENPGQTWAENSGIPWNYAYQYLVTGWENWNSNGTFALNYAKEKDAAGYIPFFPYYEMLNFTGTCTGCSEAQKDITNLNDTNVMNSYLSNYILLMKRLGTGNYDGLQGFGKTAVVHIDPDLSGYAMQAVLNNGNCYGFCTAQGNNPSYLKAAVASTGLSEVSGLPNTYQGFMWALLHIRDLYAPNVVLGYHISTWATGVDVGSDHSTTLNAAALGQQVGTFVNLSGMQNVPAGSSTFDILVSDMLDRDAGYYKTAYGNPNVWWDRLNVTFPNFHRYEDFIGAAHAQTGKNLILWQIPLGNQYFQTENNTNNHYQDNRVEYLLGQNLDFTTNHIQELKNVGVMGLLFGPGAGSQSNYIDQGPDGVTNPASFCTTDGFSSGQICNNHASSYIDDDGGYFRLMAAKYYNTNLPTPTIPPPTPTASPTPTPPAASNNSYVIYNGTSSSMTGGWSDCSWSTTHVYNNTTPTHNSEQYSINAQIDQWQALSMCYLNSGFQNGAYYTLDFWIRSDTPGTMINAQVDGLTSNNGNDVGISKYIVGGDQSLVPGKWEHVIIPLSDLKAFNVGVTRIYFVGRSGIPTPQVYISDISFGTQSSMPTPTPVTSDLLYYNSVTGNLGGGFADHSYNNPTEISAYGNTSPIHSGTYSVKAVMPPFQVFGGAGSLNTTPYKSLDFWVQAGTGSNFYIHLGTAAGGTQDITDVSPYIVSGDTSLVAGKWEHVVVPLSKMNACNTTVTDVMMMGNANNSATPNPIYFDTIAFKYGVDSSCTGGPTPTTAPTSTPAPTSVAPTGITPTATTTPSCPLKSQGDADCNGSVDITDYGQWLLEYTKQAVTTNADFSGDGQVTLIDFDIWRHTYTTPTPTPTAVPTAAPTSAPTAIPPTSVPTTVPTNGPTPTPGPAGSMQNITPSNISNDYNNPYDNYGFNSIVIDPTNPNVLFMGTNYQGLWKSTDKGGTWTKINTGTNGNLLDQGRQWCLAIDPFNHNNIWTCSGYGAGGPLKSTDGGVSWTKISIPGGVIEGDDLYSVNFDPYTPNHVLLAYHYYWNFNGNANNDSGVAESSDNGATWTLHYPPAGSGWSTGNAVFFLNNSQTWLLGSQNAGIWRTTDSGANWTQVSTIPITHGGTHFMVKDPNSNTYYIALSNSGASANILYSTDNGVTWTNTTGLPAYTVFETVVTDGTNIYTAPSFPNKTGYQDSPWYYRPLSGGAWQALTNSPHVCTNGNCNGPVFSAYDSVNHIGYGVNWNGGVWKVQGR